MPTAPRACRVFAVAGSCIAAGAIAACSGGGSRKGAPPPEASAPSVVSSAPTGSPPTEPLARVRQLPDSVRPRFRSGGADALARFVLDVPLPSDSGECGRTPSPNPGEEAVVVYYPSRAHPVSLASVVIAADGRFLFFFDRRGGLRAPELPGGLTPSQRDSAFVSFLRYTRRSSIRLNYRTGQAFLLNEGRGTPAEGLVVPIHFVARDSRFGAPDLRAREIVARCR